MSGKSKAKTPSELLAANSNLPHGFKSFISSISSLENSEKYSDLVIKCEGQEWRAHKMVVCAQSSYFQRACDGGFKESTDGIITLHRFDPEVVQAAIDYMYEQTYVAPDDPTDLGRHPLLFHVMVFTLADYLDITGLFVQAIDNFCKESVDKWDTMDFAFAIRELYDNAPDKNCKIRKHAVDLAAEHAEELLRSDDPMGAVEFRKVVSEVTVFGTQFQMAVAEADKQEIERAKKLQSGERVWVCRHRKRSFVAGPMMGMSSCPFCESGSIPTSPYHDLLEDDSRFSELAWNGFGQ